MQFEKILTCHPNYVHEIHEEDLLQLDCISLVDAQRNEQMIFLGKVDDTNEFEVRIYKENPADTFIPSHSDFNVRRYVSNDEFASFFFDSFIFARQFFRDVKNNHPEYQIRPECKS